MATDRKKNFTEFFSARGTIGVRDIATEYATTDSFTTLEKISEEHHLTRSAVSKIIQYAFENCLITYKLCIAIKDKAHQNQVRHLKKGEKGTPPSDP